jgi:hypothetical protein
MSRYYHGIYLKIMRKEERIADALSDSSKI